MNTAKKTAKKILGVILIMIGILALITPLTPGSWLVFIGLQLLGFGCLFQKRVDRFLKKWKSRKNE